MLLQILVFAIFFLRNLHLHCNCFLEYKKSAYIVLSYTYILYWASFKIRYIQT